MQPDQAAPQRRLPRAALPDHGQRLARPPPSGRRRPAARSRAPAPEPAPPARAPVLVDEVRGLQQAARRRRRPGRARRHRTGPVRRRRQRHRVGEEAARTALEAERPGAPAAPPGSARLGHRAARRELARPPARSVGSGRKPGMAGRRRDGRRGARGAGRHSISASVYGWRGRPKTAPDGTLLDHLAGVHHGDLVAQARDHAEVVRDVEDGGARALRGGRPPGRGSAPRWSRRGPSSARRGSGRRDRRPARWRSTRAAAGRRRAGAGSGAASSAGSGRLTASRSSSMRPAAAARPRPSCSRSTSTTWLPHRQHGVQRAPRVLEHHGQPAAPETPARRADHAQQVLAPVADLASHRGLFAERAQHGQGQRALPRPRLAHDARRRPGAMRSDTPFTACTAPARVR